MDVNTKCKNCLKDIYLSFSGWRHTNSERTHCRILSIKKAEPSDEWITNEADKTIKALEEDARRLIAKCS